MLAKFRPLSRDYAVFRWDGPPDRFGVRRGTVVRVTRPFVAGHPWPFTYRPGLRIAFIPGYRPAR